MARPISGDFFELSIYSSPLRVSKYRDMDSRLSSITQSVSNFGVQPRVPFALANNFERRLLQHEFIDEVCNDVRHSESDLPAAFHVRKSSPANCVEGPDF